MHSRLHMEPEALAFELRSQVYDTTTRAYAEAFLAALPHLDAESVYMRMSLMIGSYLYTFSDDIIDWTNVRSLRKQRKNINLDMRRDCGATCQQRMHASK
ncbi:hypothetical protein [Brucella pituitosa]|uniref:hypothetical protein n=1 Tax=Brucella pituitosa TaxID=571256 RepID=UPI00338F40C2